jgi:ABC-type dipeptide/oligopeptide/nickel transport system ATPase component
MRLHRLQAENFMRLKAVDVNFDDRGNLVQITGRNGAGKSSLLDSIMAAIGGKASSPERPIRKGEDRAIVTADLGDLIVQRKWTGSGASTLTVESRDGAGYKSPQAILDALLGRLTFDPLAFLRMKPREQAETLRELVGLDLSDLDSKQKEAYEERTAVNRDVKNFDAQLAAMPFHANAPSRTIDVNAKLEAYRAAMKQVRENEGARRNAATAAMEVDGLDSRIVAAERELARLKDERNKARTKANQFEESAASIVDPDVDSIHAEIEEANRVNRCVAANHARTEKAESLREATEESARLTALLASVEMERAGRLAATKFPIDGLDINADTVLFDGLPLTQASQSQRLRVSLALASALNPKLRLVLVRDTPMLDPDTLRELGEWANARDVQVLLEVVADPKAQIGVVIEDGMVGTPVDASVTRETAAV